jgi:hypothetical protein
VTLEWDLRGRYVYEEEEEQKNRRTIIHDRTTLRDPLRLFI